MVPPGHSCALLTLLKSYRGRKPNGPITSLGVGNAGIPPPHETNGSAVAPPQQPTSRPSPQPPTAGPQSMPVQQQPMTPMPFYADPNRFPTPVWQTDPSQGWQGQFIQQIPPAGQPIDTYQQYPNGIYQTTYQQPAFEANTFYAGAVQVLTPTNARPPSVPNQQSQMVPPRPNSNYAHTPSPSPAAQQPQPQQQQQSQQQPSNNRPYQEYNQFGSNNSGNEGSQSRPSSVNSVVNQNPPTPNQNFNQNQQQSQQQQPQQQTVYTTVSSATFSPSSNQQATQYVNANSGNGQPGYPQVNTSSPQVISHNSSGYPGNEQYSGHNQQQWQDHQVIWDRQHQQHQQQQQQQHQQQHQQQLADTKLEQNYQQQDQHGSQERYMHHQHQHQIPDNPSPNKMQSDNVQKTFSQADKVNLNTRIKTMILNKQQNDAKMEQDVKPVEQNNATGHFLWYSHHHHLDPLGVDGGPHKNNLPNGDDFYQNNVSHNTQSLAQNNVKFHDNVRLQYNDYTLKDVSERSNNIYDNSKKLVEGDRSYATMTSVQNNPAMLGYESNKYYNYDQSLRTDISGSGVGYNKIEPFRHHPTGSEPATGRIKQEEVPHHQSPFETITRSPVDNKDKIVDASRTLGHMFASPERTKTWLMEKKKDKTPLSSPLNKLYSPDSSDNLIKLKSQEKVDRSPPKMGEEIPHCQCFPPDQSPPEPGTYYTHLGCANNLRTLRHNLECQTGCSGPAIRIEKVKYTGKEGKTAQGCPIVKWVLRRVSVEEKYLVIVKHRTGHTCQSAFIVICLVVWDGIANDQADDLYSTLTDKLNKFGLPTKRRCATNDPRTCACQGINEDTCGASFSFGCSWSMYYNGCKFTRSKEVRKFRLSVKEEENVIEEKLLRLADCINPLYKTLAPQSFENQIGFEDVAPDCRLGTKSQRPFSGVTACIDFCAHAHKDIHNMNNGCTVVVTLTKHRGLSKPDEEQFHVLPLYVPDATDEHGSKENQDLKIRTGALEVLNKYECEVRTFSEPAAKCRNRKSKKEETQRKRKASTSLKPSSPSVSSTTLQHPNQRHPISPGPYNSSEIQSGQVSSTVLDSPSRHSSWRYDHFPNSYQNNTSVHSNGNNFIPSNLPQFSVFKTSYSYNYSGFNNYSPDGHVNGFTNHLGPAIYSNHHPTPHLFSHYTPYQFPAYRSNNPFDDMYSNNPLPPPGGDVPPALQQPKSKSVDIKYTDNSECFKDPEIGGVAIALPHGSVLFECAKHELHATTALRKPNRQNPTRISLVFYQHRNLNKSQHGLDEYTLKQKSKLDESQSDHDLSLDSSLNSSLEKCSGEVMLRAATAPTISVTTMFPMYPCMVTGPYQEHLASALSMPNK
ncbi:hypothetical protein GWI33_018801 [Rhynchophorus ferrugineus]|uniref:Methylcytosine dioxygenase TET n=1 Tax=Rhynchophorus ferrugineus TaxID=354439 RepID=A0A834HZF6_RHYFE|nr:hypothetical protein GWI33_018801 [Rhynchophorus ferrugineus]